MRSVIEETSDDISAGRLGESTTTKENAEQKGADEGEKQRGPDDDEEEQRAAEERAEARLYSEDPSEWPLPHKTGDTFRQYMVESGPQKVSDGPYPRSEKSKRCFSKAYCFRLLSNGENVERDWLLYSKNTNRVYCFACKLFGEAKVPDTCLVARCKNWRCLSKTLKCHETSSSHMSAYMMWKEMASRLRLAGIFQCVFLLGGGIQCSLRHYILCLYSALYGNGGILFPV